MYDTLFTGAYIVDGTGRPRYRADVAVHNGSIAGIGRYEAKQAKRAVNVEGKILAPGFIDVHTHADLALFKDPLQAEKTLQGVTTFIAGNCGMSPWPCRSGQEKALARYLSPIIGSAPKQNVWHDASSYISDLQKQALGCNVGLLVGNGALRIGALGFKNRPLDKKGFRYIQKNIEQAMAAGVLGLSLGIMYVPETFYSEEELVRIAALLSPFDGILTVHMRGEGRSLLASIKETVSIASKAQVKLHISHLKAAGKNMWQKALPQAAALIAKARANGADITADAYPYEAGSTSLSTLFPPWSQEGGWPKMRARFEDPAAVRAIREELAREQEQWDNILCSTGWQAAVIASLPSKKNQPLIGKNLKEIAALWQMEELDAAIRLMKEEQGQAAMVYFTMNEKDVETALSLDFSMIASDSLYADQGLPHPRRYGAFARALGRYTREKKIMNLEKAIQKMTLMPAQRFKLGAKGKIAVGFDADLTIFDENNIIDTATYQNPCSAPLGIESVWVRGQAAVENGQVSGLLPGRYAPRV